MKNFLIKNQYTIIAVLLLFNLLTLCSVNSKVNSTKRELKKVNQELSIIKEKAATLNDLKIMGLEAEKRMIQSTDRRILDVNRQSEIEKEIESLKSSGN